MYDLFNQIAEAVRPVSTAELNNIMAPVKPSFKLVYKEFISHVTGTIDLSTSQEDCAQVMATEAMKDDKRKNSNRQASIKNYFKNDSGMYHAVRDLLEKIKTEGDFNLVILKFQQLYPIFHPDWQSALRTGLVITAEKRIGNYSTGEYIYQDATAQAIREAGLNYLTPVIEAILADNTQPQSITNITEICSYINQEIETPLPY